MIAIADATIVNALQPVFNLAPERMIFGQLEYARTRWVRDNPDEPGVEALPYLAFYRTFEFGERRDWQKVDLRTDTPGSVAHANYTPIILNYTVEHIGSKVLDQVAIVRRYITWAAQTPSVTFTDSEGREWPFAVEFEPPEDNSDLEAEEESGRIVRTTVMFRVHTYVMDVTTSVTGQILEILAKVHSYQDSVDESIPVNGTEDPDIRIVP